MDSYFLKYPYLINRYVPIINCNTVPVNRYIIGIFILKHPTIYSIAVIIVITTNSKNKNCFIIVS